MNEPTIDLRSDTITRPTAAMLKAMHEANTGDDVFAEDIVLNTQTRFYQLLKNKQKVKLLLLVLLPRFL